MRTYSQILFKFFQFEAVIKVYQIVRINWPYVSAWERFYVQKIVI